MEPLEFMVLMAHGFSFVKTVCSGTVEIIKRNSLIKVSPLLWCRTCMTANKQGKEVGRGNIPIKFSRVRPYGGDTLSLYRYPTCASAAHPPDGRGVDLTSTWWFFYQELQFCQKTTPFSTQSSVFSGEL